ncbi:hypothetical protein PPYR_11119 [Photinus pyralis]|uniref:Serine protease K12H4.7 n=1 Tax=Photinus pyralis TaxID=7054 RepID=A0A5N4AIL7_PHOPY|nr:putative serine protease K12H4.7 [Photinus pyralis]XP_031347456.1 putative serine protease K12H4.7 [Photinus pyralis]KAB0797058.1 hypothetical protein PPYR_11119 [Photinus pyralis]
MKLVISILQLILIQADCWKIFHRGREVGGNLGAPYDVGYKATKKLAQDEWFIQRLDHFNPTDLRVWKQRYFTNDQFYKVTHNGPIFLMIGGEGTASPLWMNQGAWIDYAKRFKALCFQLEHRYYGKSHPTEDMSTKNLQYLTSQQALADLAAFIQAKNEEYGFSSNVKWIVFGGSYPGSLAAWMRLKYPHLVHGAMSASGPLLAKADFPEYYHVVEESLKTASSQCLSTVKEATAQVEIFLNHTVGYKALDSMFNLCDPIENSINNPKDISNFYVTLAENIAGIVQYNKDNRIGGNQKVANITIDTICDIMEDDDMGAPIDKLAEINRLLMNANNLKCLDYKYDKMIQELSQNSWSSNVSEGGRQWMYQTCTEFGFFQSSSQPPYIFGTDFPVEFYIQQCVDIFGEKYNSAFVDTNVQRTNTFYGALDIDVSNVVFVHGSIDPWHALGITKTREQRAPAIYIEGTAHCANMYPKSEKDLPQLKAARVEIAEHIDAWIRL